jgi:hypothetical protein
LACIASRSPPSRVGTDAAGIAATLLYTFIHRLARNGSSIITVVIRAPLPARDHDWGYCPTPRPCLTFPRPVGRQSAPR